MLEGCVISRDQGKRHLAIYVVQFFCLYKTLFWNVRYKLQKMNGVIKIFCCAAVTLFSSFPLLHGHGQNLYTNVETSAFGVLCFKGKALLA